MSTIKIQKKNSFKDTPYISISNSKSDSSNLQIESSHLSLNSNHSSRNINSNNQITNQNTNTFTNANISNLITSHSGCELNISKSTFDRNVNMFNNQISFDNSSFFDGGSNNNLQISSNSIIFKKNDNSSIITKKNSMLYSPSTLCNYYDVTPNKTNNNKSNQNGNKPKLKQIAITNLNLTSKSDENDNSLISEHVNGSNNRKKYFEKKTPIKYTKSQLKSGEKKKLNFPLDNLSSINNTKNNSYSNNSYNYYSGIVGSSSCGGNNALTLEHGKNGGITSRKNLMDTFEKISKENEREYYSNNVNEEIKKDLEGGREKVDLYFMKVLSERDTKKDTEKLTHKKNDTFSFDNKNNHICTATVTTNLTNKKVTTKKGAQTSRKSSTNEKKKRPLSFTKKISVNFKPSVTVAKKPKPVNPINRTTPKSIVPIVTPRNKTNLSFKKSFHQQHSFSNTSRPSSTKKSKPISLTKKMNSAIPVKSIVNRKPKSLSKPSQMKLNLNLYVNNKQNINKKNNSSSKLLPNAKSKYIINTTSSSKTSNCSTSQKENKKSTPKESIDLNNKISKVKINLYDKKKQPETTKNKQKVINNFSFYRKTKNTTVNSKGRNGQQQKENLSTQIKFDKLQILPGDSDSEITIEDN